MIVVLSILYLFVYITSWPGEAFREWLAGHFRNERVKQLVLCAKCSSFWLALPMYYVLPMLPTVLHFMVLICALVTLAEWIYLKYFD